MYNCDDCRSNTNPVGLLIDTVNGGPSYGSFHAELNALFSPVPAIVVTIPFGDSILTILLSVSEI